MKSAFLLSLGAVALSTGWMMSLAYANPVQEAPDDISPSNPANYSNQIEFQFLQGYPADSSDYSESKNAIIGSRPPSGPQTVTTERPLFVSFVDSMFGQTDSFGNPVPLPAVDAVQSVRIGYRIGSGATQYLNIPLNSVPGMDDLGSLGGNTQIPIPRGSQGSLQVWAEITKTGNVLDYMSNNGANYSFVIQQ